MVTKRLRNPRALSSTLAVLGMLQPRALGFLNHLVTLVSASNFYLYNILQNIVVQYYSIETNLLIILSNRQFLNQAHGLSAPGFLKTL